MSASLTRQPVYYEARVLGRLVLQRGYRAAVRAQAAIEQTATPPGKRLEIFELIAEGAFYIAQAVPGAPRNPFYFADNWSAYYAAQNAILMLGVKPSQKLTHKAAEDVYNDYARGRPPNHSRPPLGVEVAINAAVLLDGFFAIPMAHRRALYASLHGGPPFTWPP